MESSQASLNSKWS